MKYCEEYAALISAYLDHELPEEECIRLEAHLDQCPGCRNFLQQLQAIEAQFPTVDEVAVPEDFTDTVMATIRAQQSRRKARRKRLRTMVPLAAGLAFIILLGGTQGLFASFTENAASGGAAASSSSQSYSLHCDASFEEGQSPEAAEMEDAVPSDTAPESNASSKEIFSSAGGASESSGGQSSQQTSPSSERIDGNSSADTPTRSNDTSDSDISPDIAALQNPDNSLYFTRIYLTEQQAGDVFANYTGESYNDGTLSGVAYTLSKAEYDALSDLMPELVPPEEAQSDAYALVIVTTD